MLKLVCLLFLLPVKAADVHSVFKKSKLNEDNNFVFAQLECRPALFMQCKNNAGVNECDDKRRCQVPWFGDHCDLSESVNIDIRASDGFQCHLSNFSRLIKPEEKDFKCQAPEPAESVSLSGEGVASLCDLYISLVSGLFRMVAYGTDMKTVFDVIANQTMTKTIVTDKSRVGINTVEMKPNNTDYRLCEVELFGERVCKVDRYGPFCDGKCNCSVHAQECLSLTGVCVPPTKDLPTCPRSCHHGCDKKTLTCAMCSDKFDGPTCSDCVSGYYSEDCDKECPSSCLNAQCNRTTGRCLVCPSKDSLCMEVCPAGTYGSDCENPCPKNCKTNMCHVGRGDCLICEKFTYLEPCNDGKTDCEARNCIPCSPDCFNSSCNSKTGKCLRCRSGFSGDMCTVKGTAAAMLHTGGSNAEPLLMGCLIPLGLFCMTAIYKTLKKRPHGSETSSSTEAESSSTTSSDMQGKLTQGKTEDVTGEATEEPTEPPTEEQSVDSSSSTTTENTTFTGDVDSTSL